MKNYTEIHDYLKKNLSLKRYKHTVEVAKECKYYADIFDLSEDDRDILHAAALLHDITKEKNPEEQLRLCRVYNIEFDRDYLSTPSLFHAKTGSELAAQLFPEVCTSTVKSIIAVHTTGTYDMTLLQKLLYIADYTEATRKHQSCVTLREMFRNNRENCDRMKLLDDVIIKSFDFTIGFLIETGKPINTETIKSRNFLVCEKQGT